MKHIQSFKLYESLAGEKYIYLLIDRSQHDSFDKRVRKMSSIDTVYIFRVHSGRVISSLSTGFIYSSKLGELTRLEQTLGRAGRADITMDKIEIMMRFAKRNAGCICKEFSTIDELATALEIKKHTTNKLELSDAHADITSFIKGLRPIPMTKNKRSWRNHLLINSGHYSGHSHVIINDRGEQDFWFNTHYEGEVKFSEDVERYFSPYSFLTNSGYFNRSNDEYSMYSINKTQQTQLKNLVKEARELYVDFSKAVVATLKAV